MVPAYESLGGVAIAFYVTSVLIGLYLMMNLFIAILLNAFAEDDDEALATARTARTARTDRPREEEEEEEEERRKRLQGLPERPWPHDYSLFCFGPSNPLRIGARRLTSHQHFDSAIIAAIVASSVCLAMDSPRLDPNAGLARTLKRLDLFWTALFASELLLKVVAHGFCFGRKAYVKSPWNLLDLAIVCVSFLVLLAEAFPVLRPLKTLRVLRALRPLRLVSRNPGMKVIIVSLFKALPAVSNVMGVILAFQLVFAILGMQLFMGVLHRCSEPTILTRELCYASPPPPPPLFSGRRLSQAAPPVAPPPGVRSQSQRAVSLTDSRWQGSRSAPPEVTTGLPLSTPSAPLALLPSPPPLPSSHLASARWRDHLQPPPFAYESRGQRRRRLKGGGGAAQSANLKITWSNPPVGSFDNFGGAMLLLYVMSTGDGWDTLMFATMDATERGHAPVRNDFSAAALFSVIWMFVGSFFAINLFVGVIVDNFNRISKEGSSATLTPEQKQWQQAMKAQRDMRPVVAMRPPANPLRNVLYRLISSTAFDGFITAVIVLNVLTMACDYWGIEQDERPFRYYNNAMMAFSYIYYVEFALKITALGPANYFGDNWCRFDFFLVCSSLVDQFAAELLAAVLPLPPMLLRVLRVFRILRILRLLKGAKELRNLILTMILSFPSLLNVCSILALVVFMYAVLGVNLYTWVVRKDNITPDRNFETLGHGMLLLFQCLTGDGWSGVMTDLTVDEDSGICTHAAGNCGSPSAVPFFVSFQVIGSFVFLNLVIAVILENFSSLGETRSDLVSAANIAEFQEAWATYDPDADQYVPTAQLPYLLLDLPPPMGVRGFFPPGHAGGARLARRLCIKLKLKQRNGEVHFSDVLEALVRYSYEAANELVEDDDEAGDDHRVNEAADMPPTKPSKVAAAVPLADGGDQQDVARALALDILRVHQDKLRSKRRRIPPAKLTQLTGSPPDRSRAPMAAGDLAAPMKLRDERSPRRVRLASPTAAQVANGCGHEGVASCCTSTTDSKESMSNASRPAPDGAAARKEQPLGTACSTLGAGSVSQQLQPVCRIGGMTLSEWRESRRQGGHKPRNGNRLSANTEADTWWVPSFSCKRLSPRGDGAETTAKRRADQIAQLRAEYRAARNDYRTGAAAAASALRAEYRAEYLDACKGATASATQTLEALEAPCVTRGGTATADLPNLRDGTRHSTSIPSDASKGGRSDSAHWSSTTLSTVPYGSPTSTTSGEATHTRTLVISRIRAYKVPGADLRSGSDPYVSFTLLGAPPRASPVRVATQDVRNAVSPVWQETLSMPLPGWSGPHPLVLVELFDRDPEDEDDLLCRAELRLEESSARLDRVDLQGVGHFANCKLSFSYDIGGGGAEPACNGSKPSTSNEPSKPSSPSTQSTSLVPPQPQLQASTNSFGQSSAHSPARALKGLPPQCLGPTACEPTQPAPVPRPAPIRTPSEDLPLRPTSEHAARELSETGNTSDALQEESRIGRDAAARDAGQTLQRIGTVEAPPAATSDTAGLALRQHPAAQEAGRALQRLGATVLPSSADEGGSRALLQEYRMTTNPVARSAGEHLQRLGRAQGGLGTGGSAQPLTGGMNSAPVGSASALIQEYRALRRSNQVAGETRSLIASSPASASPSEDVSGAYAA